MPREKADLDWYKAESRKQRLSPRCPIACAELCPRYYQSLDALGRVDLTTQMPTERLASLERKWRVFRPVIAEEEPWISSSPEEEVETRLSINHFCPEVSYEIFGYFASDMFEYRDEMDRGAAEKAYESNGVADQFDGRWARVRPRHYTECREYSIHGTFAVGKSSGTPPARRDVSPKRRWQVLARDSFTCVYCGRKPPEVALHADHKVSVKDGGSDDLDNLVTACDECNGGKSGSSL